MGICLYPSGTGDLPLGADLGTLQMSSTALRPHKPDDNAFLFALYADTRKDELDAWGWAAEQREAFLRQQFAAQGGSYSAQFSDAEHRIILKDGQSIGRILVHRTEAEFRLVDISILASSRGAGIGTSLIRDLLDEALSAAKPVRLHVLRNNPAARLYHRLGFRVISDDGLYLGMEAPARSGNAGPEGSTAGAGGPE